MVDKREIGKLDLPPSERQNFGVNEVIIAHVVDLYTAIMVRFKELDDIILTVSKQFIEAFTGKTHSYDSFSDIA